MSAAGNDQKNATLLCAKMLVPSFANQLGDAIFAARQIIREFSV